MTPGERGGRSGPSAVRARLAAVRADDRVQGAAIALAAAAQFGTVMLLGTVMAVLIGAEASAFAVSLVLTCFFLGLVVFAPIWGAVADVTGRRRAVLLTTTAFATLSLLPLVAVNGVVAQLGFRLLSSAFAAGFVPVMLTVVDHRGGEETGRALGLFNSARSAGATGAQLLAGVLLGTLAPGATFAVLTCLSALAVAGVAVVSDPTPTPDRSASPRAIAGEVRDRVVPTAGGPGLPADSGLGWLYVGITLRNVTVMGVASLMPVFLVREVGLSAFAMGVVLAVGPATQIASMYLVGVASDTLPRKPLISVGIAGNALFPLLAAASIVPTGALARRGLAVAAFLGKSLPFSALMIGSVAFIADVAPPDRESELMGLRQTFKGLGGIVGPALHGLVATRLGFTTALLAGSTLALLGALVVHRGLVETGSPGAAPTSG